MPPRLSTLILTLALLGAACAGSTPIITGTDATSSTTSAPAVSVVFGSGRVPDTMPLEFPIPAEAVVGSTLIDHNRSRTEMMVRVSTDIEALIAFIDTNLRTRGFGVGFSREDGPGWLFEFSSEAGSGTIEIASVGQGISQAFVIFTAEL